MSTFQNFPKTNVTPQYLEKLSKIVKNFWSLTLFRPQSNNCLVRVNHSEKKSKWEEEGCIFFEEAILFSRGYYMMLDMMSIEIIQQPFDPLQLTAHTVIKDGFPDFLLVDNSPYFLFMN